VHAPALRLCSRLLLAAAVVAGCGGGPPPAPNVVLISIDSLRPDHLGVYGYDRDTSPHLDALAKSSVVFERAWSTSSWTLPPHVSLLSGLHSNAHGVTRWKRRIPAALPLLPELLAARGYRSAAVVSGMLLHRRYGFDRGWVDYRDDLVGPHVAMHSLVSSELVHARALEQLDRLGSGPFLLFLHYFDVHYDYAPPPPWDRHFDPGYDGALSGADFARSTLFQRDLSPRDLEHLEALYDGEIRWVDHWLGRLFAELERRGLAESTLVLVLADHGDEFYDHGRLGHAKNLYDSTLRIPLIVRFPGGRHGGRRIAAPVSLVDVAPTILRAAGLEVPASWPGRDLARAFTRAGLPDAPILADLNTTNRRRKILLGDWTAIFSFRPGQRAPSRRELYDLATDARELDDRARAHPQRLDELWRRHQVEHRRSLEIAARFRSERVQPDPEFDRELRALGYL